MCLERRVSYRRLKKEFGLDDETLDDVRHELIVKRLAVDEGGQGLALVGAALFETGDLPPPAFAPVAAPAAAPAADCAERALRICEEQRIAQYRAWGLCENGWALAVSGEGEKGLVQIAQGVDSFGIGTSQHILLALQADAQLAIGKPEAALASVAAGLKSVEKMRGAPLAAELYRLTGEALLTCAGTVSAAETAIEKGISVAGQQNAKSWELRGAMSLARLRRQQGRQQEAAVLLAPILGWFTEGFDTADLKDAKALLDKLTEPAIAADG